MDDAVAKALHAVRHHLAGGGFLSDLFSGPDYLSTGEVASPTNWGDPESAADFFKADKADKALRLAREVQEKGDDVTGSIPVRAPLTAPRPGAVEVRDLPVNIPFNAPDRGVSILSSDISPASVTALPLAYSPEAPAAPAAAAIDAATGKMTARMPDEPHGTALTQQQADYVIRTIAAETSGKSPEETQAIASVILNRINSGKYGASPEAVLFAKRQFEPWMNPAGTNYPMKISPKSQRYSDARDALEAAMAGEDITGGATHFWGPKAQFALGREAPSWGRTGGVDIGETRFHKLGRAHGGEVDDALRVVREHHADGEAVGPVSTDNSERVRAAESAANLAKQIQAYEASMANIRQQPQDIQSMTHAPEKPRAPISIEALGKNREFGSAPYDVAGPLSTLAQGAYDLKTAPLYAFPPTAPLGMAIDTAEGVASGSPTQVAMGALGGPLKVARNVIAPLAVATGVTAPDEAEAGSLERALQALRAWHGSPYKFNKFDASKVGTGEGQQVYGKGMYYAQDKNRALEFVGNPEDRYRRFSGQMSPKEEIAFDMANQPNARDMDIMTVLAKKYGDNITFDEAMALASDAMKKRGALYEVDIHQPKSQFLHWQKPLSDQSPEIQKLLTPEALGLREALLPGGKNYAWVDETGLPVGSSQTIRMPEAPFQPSSTGSQIYNMIGHNNPDRATGILRDVGVAGNTYVDPKGFGLSSAPHNYVVFNPERDVDILNQYAQGGEVEPASVEDRALMLVSRQA